MSNMDLFSNKATELVRLDQITIEPSSMTRLPTGLNLFDCQILGGDEKYGFGFLKGSVLMLGGEPGSGKTTLLMQILDQMSGRGIKCIYNSAEEPASQLKMTSERCQVTNASNMYIGNIGEVERVIEVVRESQGDILVLDSIQGFHVASSSTRSRTVRMQESCDLFIKFAKDAGIPLIIICQLTSTGDFKGPKDLEHNVDICGKLSVPQKKAEADEFRILNLSKNRFGPVGQHTYLPWLNNYGRYDIEHFAKQIEVEAEAVVEDVKRQAPRIQKVSFDLSDTLFSHSQKIAMVAVLVREYHNQDISLVLDVITNVRDSHGEFELSEDDHDDLGLPREKMIQLLQKMSSDPRFQLCCKSPLKVLV